MTQAGVAALSRTLAALAEAAAAHPFERKLLVTRRMGIGREMLRALAVNGVSWIGFDVTTPLRLAHELAASDLAERDLTVMDEFDELALLDAAMDAALDGSGGRLARLAEGIGLRRAVGASVRALRRAGLTADDIDGARFRDEDKRADIGRILREYETRLAASARLDAAGVLDTAVRALAAGAELPQGARIYLAPDRPDHGLAGRLIRLLAEGGAAVLPADPVHGLAEPSGMPAAWSLPDDDVPRTAAESPLSWLHDPAGWSAVAPSSATTPGVDEGNVILDVFAASSVTAELREVLRRAVAAGLRWDEVEIVTTDAAAYGVALDGLARRLGIPVTHAAGLPLNRTRPGRAVSAYLEWVQRGFPADVLRRMLERGDIVPPDTAVSGVGLARRLRSLRIGRGRERYEPALARREAALNLPQAPDDERTPEQFTEDRAAERAGIAALAAVVRPLLAATPDVSDGGEFVRVVPADLARGAIALLDRVAARDAVERAARSQLLTRLRRVAQTITRPATMQAAAAVLLDGLSDRVPATGVGGAAPWTAAGGHLHLSDLDHGGYTCRPATFVVGVDAARFPGAGGSDALLVDDDRRRLNTGHEPVLPLSAERIAERRHAFAALAARLRGRVTFSYATWDAVEGRAVAPAAELLQVHRLLSGDATADYEALHDAVSPPASAVPRGSSLLDAADVWLHALAHDADAAGSRGALRRGVTAVCDAYPHLAAGVRAWKTRRRSPVPTPYHGLIEPRPELDPRRTSRVVSSTQLQTLGACPHRYLLRYVLRVRAPDDPSPSPEHWLPPGDRGVLMHAVFERALREAEHEGTNIDGDDFENLVLGIVDAEAAAARELLPPPGEAMVALELERLREDARAFIAMVREDGLRSIALERRFGRAGAEPVDVPLPDGGMLRLAGVIDRVDRLDDGTLVVIDYKTGSSLRYGGSTGAFDGGRRLQHVLYAAAAERLFDATVTRAEYHFPTRRSENHRARYHRQQLRDGLGLVTELLDLAGHGWFVPTNDAEDCRNCDYKAACRVRTDDYGKVASPLAEWSREAHGDAPDLLRRLRR